MAEDTPPPDPQVYDVLRGIPEPQIPRQVENQMQVYLRQLHDWVNTKFGVLTPANITNTVINESNGIRLLHSDMWESNPAANYDGAGYQLSRYSMQAKDFRIGDLIRVTFWGTVTWSGGSCNHFVNFKIGPSTVKEVQLSNTSPASGSQDFFIQAVVRAQNQFWGVVSGDLLDDAKTDVVGADSVFANQMTFNYKKDTGTVNDLQVKMEGCTIERVLAPLTVNHDHEEPDFGTCTNGDCTFSLGSTATYTLNQLGVGEESGFRFSEDHIVAVLTMTSCGVWEGTYSGTSFVEGDPLDSNTPISGTIKIRYAGSGGNWDVAWDGFDWQGGFGTGDCSGFAVSYDSVDGGVHNVGDRTLTIG